jgi:hypothetical protein
LSTAGMDAPRTPSVGRNDDIAASPNTVHLMTTLGAIR